METIVIVPKPNKLHTSIVVQIHPVMTRSVIVLRKDSEMDALPLCEEAPHQLQL